MTKKEAITKYKQLDETEFSEITGIPVETLRGARKVGGDPDSAPPHIKRGRSIRYLLSDYEAWCARNRSSAEDLKKSS
jgi:hypothetical protein